jgi:hypothetical protein
MASGSFVEAQWSTALEQFTNRLEESPQDAVCLVNRAAVYLALELNRKCIKDCDAAIGIDKCNLRAYLLKGKAYQALKKGKKATHTFNEGVVAGANGGDVFLFIELRDLVAGKAVSTAANGAVRAAPLVATDVSASVSPPPAPVPLAAKTEAKRQAAKQALSTQSEADVNAATHAAKSKMVNHGSGVQEVDQVRAAAGSAIFCRPLTLCCPISRRLQLVTCTLILGSTNRRSTFSQSCFNKIPLSKGLS